MLTSSVGFKVGLAEEGVGVGLLVVEDLSTSDKDGALVGRGLH